MNDMEKNTPVEDAGARDVARQLVRAMMQVTGWTASRLAVEAGLAASTLNRFMNHDVKHTLKFTTLSRLLLTSLARLNQRIEIDNSLTDSEIEAVLPLMERFDIDLEMVAGRFAADHPSDKFWRIDTLRNKIRSLTGADADDGNAVDDLPPDDGNGRPPGPYGFDLPVLGAAKGGEDALFFDNGTVHEHIRRPPNLEGVDNGFAVYMVGDSMEPRYFAGEFLYANPNRPPVRNCFVIVELADGQGLVKQFIKFDDAALHLHQFNPAKDLEIGKNRVRSVHRIVGTGEP